jgi:hypothetical protein
MWLNKTTTPPASIVVTEEYYDRIIKRNLFCSRNPYLVIQPPDIEQANKFTSPYGPDLLWDPPSLSNGYRDSFPWDKAVGA